MDALTKQSQDGLAFEGLRDHHAFPKLIDLFKELYADAVDKLIANESPEEARVTIHVIETIVSRIDDTIRLGVQAREEIRSKVFENQM